MSEKVKFGAPKLAVEPGVRLLRDMMMVRVDPRIQTTESGIIVGHGQIERPELLTGTVLAVGPAVGECAVGDRVTFAKEVCYLDLSKPSDEKLIVKEEQIEAIL